MGAAKLRAAKAKTERGRNPAMLAHLINKVDVQEVRGRGGKECGRGGWCSDVLDEFVRIDLPSDIHKTEIRSIAVDLECSYEIINN